MKGYKLRDPENKKILLSQHVTFDETSLLKSTVSQQVERTKTKDVPQRVEDDATLPSPVGSVSVRTSSDVTPRGDHVAVLMLNRLKTLMRMSNCLQLLNPR